jgi:hypothetical protein
MNRKYARILLAMLLAIGFVGIDAIFAQSEGKGSVSGRVLDDAGKPLAGLALRLERFTPMGVGGDRGKRGRSTGLGSGATELQGLKVIARATTDQNGNFSMANVEAGGATLIAGNQKIGWIYHELNIEANKETKLGDLKLTKTD